MIVSKVKEITREKEVTYQELIKRTGISGDTVARCRSERIKECSLGTLEAIASALGVTTKELYDEHPAKEDTNS